MSFVGLERVVLGFVLAFSLVLFGVGYRVRGVVFLVRLGRCSGYLWKVGGYRRVVVRFWVWIDVL